MISTIKLSWAAGFLEGEGTFYFKKSGIPSEITLAAVQVQKEPLERLMEYFGGALYLTHPKNKNWAPQWNWRINGTAAIAVMMTVYTLMSPKRQEQIEAAITHWKRAKHGRRPKNSPICLQGHMLSKVGLNSKGRCKVCARKSYLSEYYRRKERLNEKSIETMY